MSQDGSNRPRSALADGAERMNVLSRTVREQQLAEKGALRAAVMDVYSTSPDEAWHSRYMSQGIGPAPDCASPGGYCAIPFALPVAPQAATSCSCEDATQSPRPQLGLAQAVVQTAAYQQIGQAIGKPAKRSWFRRRRSP